MYLVTCYFGFAGSNDLDEAIHANRVYFELIRMTWMKLYTPIEFILN